MSNVKCVGVQYYCISLYEYSVHCTDVQAVSYLLFFITPELPIYSSDTRSIPTMKYYRNLCTYVCVCLLYNNKKLSVLSVCNFPCCAHKFAISRRIDSRLAQNESHILDIVILCIVSMYIIISTAQHFVPML